jgi:aspartyl-tRNA(Asn)/glutamyl-tRNA(Gln) amidotransferase subunit C
MSHVFPVNNVFREDVVENGDDREALLKNAPEERDGTYVVPITVE